MRGLPAPLVLLHFLREENHIVAYLRSTRSLAIGV